MYLAHLSLHEFRNYHELDLALGRGLFLFYGDNAQGKTNLIEAVAMLATGSSFHAAADREVVNWHAPEHLARLRGEIKRCDEEVQVEIMVFDPMPPRFENQEQPLTPLELPANTPRKRIKINGIPRRTMELIGQLRVVLFSPADLHLVDGSPEERRRFLDRALCQVRPHYCQALVQYRKVIVQRAALLKRVRDHEDDPRMLDYLDERLTALASQIIFERQHMIDFLNGQTGALQKMLSGGKERLRIVYHSSFTVDSAWNVIDAEQYYRAQLRQARPREIQQGICLLGPHRDDLEFAVNGVNMQTYGSRGQQRTSALAAKLAELAYMRANTAEEPVLLLDDVFSELDEQRREHLLQEVQRHEQVLLTATAITSIPADMLARASMYRVNAGGLRHDL